MKRNPFYEKPDCSVVRISTAAVIVASYEGSSSEGLNESWNEEWN